MGLINEIQGVKASMKRNEQEKIKKQNRKILLEEYNNEIKSNLQAIFYKLFENNTEKEAYKKAILEKEKNIEIITNIIESIYYRENGKKYQKFGRFDIVGDLQANYFSELDKIHKEYIRIEKIKEQEEKETTKQIETIEERKKQALLKKLENDFTEYLSNAKYKYIAKNTLQKNDIIKMVIEDIATTEEEAEILKNNYFIVFAKVIKYYNGDIKEEQEEIKERKQEAKEKAQAAKVARRDHLLCLHILNRWLK